MTRQRFYLLDGLRGIAAIVVLLFHCVPGLPVLGPWFQSGYLSVDFFFMLSGFVVARAYEVRLLADMRFGHFAEIRMIRLYPLYMLGCLIGVMVVMVEAVHAHALWPMREAVWALPWAVLMLPRPSWNIQQNFALNPPTWSLFFELAINLAYAGLIARLTDRVLRGVAMLALLIMVGQAILTMYGVDGHDYALLASAPRPIFAFPFGVLIYRWWRSGRLPRLNVPPSVIYMLFLLGPVRGAYAPLIAIVVAAAGFPILIAAGVTSAGALRPSRVAGALGDLSYPLYATHLPCLTATTTALTYLGVTLSNAYLVGLAALAVLAWATSQIYDPLVRGTLTRWAGLRRREIEAAMPL